MGVSRWGGEVVTHHCRWANNRNGRTASIPPQDGSIQDGTAGPEEYTWVRSKPLWRTVPVMPDIAPAPAEGQVPKAPDCDNYFEGLSVEDEDEDEDDDEDEDG